ncbi:MAG TPA: cytochrome c biogenesis protein CcsA, partial [Anaeromyxobacteraceae bacterium]|nr:cytochrome c biogenesis protein CcsA [Anaeromyxobacteraceae bacterium]
SWRKAGLWMLHAGLVLLVAGEFASRALQVETRLAIEQGETKNYSESPRDMELAFIDASDPNHDDVYGVPESLLARGGKVEIPGTPFALVVRGFYQNARLSARSQWDPPSLATEGVGANMLATELPPVASDDEVNESVAYIEPVAGGKSQGTWLVSNALSAPQSFTLEGRSYQLAMRPRRYYLPYSLTLKKFQHDVYAGTDIPKNFSSLVHLADQGRGEERDVLIYMNQPLRYRGKAFYQASFGKGDKLSVLQVVENPSWLLPYISCALVAAGLLLHFTLALCRSLGRRDARETVAAGPGTAGLARFAPWLAFGLALAGALAALAPSAAVGGLDLDRFARLPVLEGGRVKPVDSVARNALLAIRGQKSLRHDGRVLGPGEWLLDVLFRPGVADAESVFVIDEPEVRGFIGLAQSADRYASFNDLGPKLEEIEKQAQSARAIEPRERTRFQSAIVNLFDRLVLYYRLRNTMQLDGTPGLGAEIVHRLEPPAAERQKALSALAYFRPVPPVASARSDDWQSVGQALGRADLDPALPAWAELGAAYSAGDARAFDQAAADLGQRVDASTPGARGHADRELLFNRAEPFYAGMVIYALALLVLFASWLGKPKILRSAAFGLLACGALVHTAGLVARIVLQGRPPVTNLYSSAVFVGWVVVMVGAVLERLHRRGFGTAVAAACGFASLIVAHHLTGDGDTMEMMRAVLDSNFWLATHVPTIAVGYGGTFLAGGLAIGYALGQHLGRGLTSATVESLVSLTYGVVCFALLFSFVGTVLGGIWADQSWGRFWGWDPKENGALLIVLWNALILHARWAGYVRERGFMAMAILGNVITSLSWFGVNMLGVGLHSYGFMDKAFYALSAFIATQLVLAAVCLMPRRLFKESSSVQAREASGGVG